MPGKTLIPRVTGQKFHEGILLVVLDSEARSMRPGISQPPSGGFFYALMQLIRQLCARRDTRGSCLASMTGMAP